MKFLCRLLISIYQYLLSPWLGPCCRFEPSCSKYAKQAIDQHHIFKAGCLILWRVLRCQPFAKAGFDPVPLNDKSRDVNHCSINLIEDSHGH